MAPRKRIWRVRPRRRAFGGCGLVGAHLEPLTSDVKRRTDNGDYELVRKGTPTSLQNAILGVLIKEKVDAKLMELLKENRCLP